MSNVNYAQAVSRIRAIETKLLDKTKIDRMIESNSSKEAFKILQETEYGNLFGNIKRVEDYEVILSEALKKLYKLMYEITYEKLVIDVMSVRYDYHNIKVLLKQKILKTDLRNLLIPVATVPVDKMKIYVSNKNYYDLNPIMREAIEKSEDSFESEKDPQKIDIILDHYMYKDMLFKAETLGEKYLLEFLKINIDLTNLKTLLRVKKQNKARGFLEEALIDGGKIDRDVLVSMLNDSNESIASRISYTDYEEILRVGIDEFSKSGSLNMFEKLSDNFIMNFIKDSKYVSFGIEPLLAYIFAKENEIKIVRIIMVGKLNNVAGDVIRERLRDIYV